jgi:hypothetical protein
MFARVIGRTAGLGQRGPSASRFPERRPLRSFRVRSLTSRLRDGIVLARPQERRADSGQTQLCCDDRAALSFQWIYSTADQRLAHRHE